MTNYKRWDLFDVDIALDEIDSKDSKIAAKEAVSKSAKSTLARQTSLQREAQNAAEYRDIKESVNSLLQRGNLAGYYRQYKKTQYLHCKVELDPLFSAQSTLVVSPEDSVESEPLTHIPESVTERMMIVAGQLGDVILLIQQLQKNTEVLLLLLSILYTIYNIAHRHLKASTLNLISPRSIKRVMNMD